MIMNTIMTMTMIMKMKMKMIVIILITISMISDMPTGYRPSSRCSHRIARYGQGPGR